MTSIKLVIGLGNPGKKYAKTRHNIGFMVVEKLAEEWGWSFKEESDFFGRYVKGEDKGVPIHLALPETYMNESGKAASAILRFYKLNASDCIIVHDDIALEFGHLRVKAQGSSGGHNGLKSIEEWIHSSYYPRLKIGIGDKRNGTLADHVLAPFTEEELKELPGVIEEAVKVLKAMIHGNIHMVMNATNKKVGEKNEKKNPSI